MAIRRFAPFGKSPVDRLVLGFIQEKGISPNDITGYCITRSVDDIGTITFSMLFDEGEVSAQPDPPVSQNYIGGPELTVSSELLCKCMDLSCTKKHYHG